MTQDEREQQRLRIFTNAGWRCEVCGVSLNGIPHPQLAHRIADKSEFRRKYGKSVLDHDLNKVATCGLACNAKCNIGQNPFEADKLVDEIKKALDGGGISPCGVIYAMP